MFNISSLINVCWTVIEKYPALSLTSLSTIKRARMDLGWTSKKTRYCALISEGNREKRLNWCKERVELNDIDLDDIIGTDECSVQLESHRKVTFHKSNQPSRLKGRAKHPPKVHIWGGISCKGATAIVLFFGYSHCN